MYFTKEQKFLCPATFLTSPYLSLHLNFYLYPLLYNKLVNVFPWLLWAVPANHLTQGGIVRTVIYSQLVRSTAEIIWDWQLWTGGGGGGQLCETDPLTCGDLTPIPSKQYQTWTELYASQLVWRTGHCGGSHKHIWGPKMLSVVEAETKQTQWVLFWQLL